MSTPKKSVGDPHIRYRSLNDLWGRNRAIIRGQRFAKAYDTFIDTINFKNLLLPFSPTMTQKQYDFFKSEAELPGICSQYVSVIVGGLLRKGITLDLPDSVPEEAKNWILNDISIDGKSLVSFLDSSLNEEFQTGRTFVQIDLPVVPNFDDLTPEERKQIAPFLQYINAESVINWRSGVDRFGKQALVLLVIRTYEENLQENEFHPTYMDTVYVHDLDTTGYYRIRKYQKAVDSSPTNVVGDVIQNYNTVGEDFSLIYTNTNFLVNGERIDYIPIFPLNGEIEPIEPLFTALVDREVALYNKVSRRNHLLLGAATYTPVIMSDMSDDEFGKVVQAGLGSWLHLSKDDKIDTLKTPTDALNNMEESIKTTLDELAKLGIRMLSPESAESGVALEIRNAAQTARLGSLNTKISQTMRDVITIMLNWRYNLDLKIEDISFTLSNDFNPVPIGEEFMRIIGEWYSQGLIDRPTFIGVLKANDIVGADYDDDEAQKAITTDPLIKEPVDTESTTMVKK